MNRFIIWICKFIPKIISNSFLIFCLQVMRRLQRHGDMFVIGNGSRKWESDGFIENQHSMKDINIGMAPMSETGCEVIATYNALLNLGKSPSLGKLIEEYERDGIIHSGRFGVAPKAIADNLKRHGLGVDFYIPGKKRQDVEGFSAKYNTLIVTYYNDYTDLYKQIHTVAITRDDSGYTLHNAYCNGRISKAQATIMEAIGSVTAGMGRPIILIGIKDK